MNTITLQWTAPSNTGGIAISGYTVYVKKSSDASYTKTGENIIPLNYVVQNLVAGTEYDFKVTASNAQGEGKVPSYLLKHKATFLPGQVTNVKSEPLSLTKDAITVQWTAANDGGSPITKYVIKHTQAGVMNSYDVVGATKKAFTGLTASTA